MKTLHITELTRDVVLNINTFLPVQTGMLVVKQDSVGSHTVSLGASTSTHQLIGDVPVYSGAGSNTLIKWICTDDKILVYSELSPDYLSIVGGGSSGGTITDAYTKAQSDSRFYPLGSNPANYTTQSWVLSQNYLTSGSFSNYYTKTQSDAKYLTGYTSSETLDSVLGRGNTSNKNINVSGVANFSGKLLIPSSSANTNNSLWIGEAATGVVIPTGGTVVSYLSALLDTQITSPVNGQSLIFNGFKWVNTTSFGGDYNSLTNKPTALSQFINDAGFITNFSESDTLNSVLSRGNSSGLNMNLSGKVSLTGELIIPASASTSNQSIWIGVSNSTGSTGSSGVSLLAALTDVNLTSPAGGQALIYNGLKWVNQTIITDLSAYYTASQVTSLFKSINYVPSWNEISNRPTALSQFANDSGYVTASIVNGYATISALNSAIAGLSSVFHPLENQRLSTGNNVTFNAANIVTQLQIPTSSSTANNSIWIGTANSTGSTGGGTVVSYLSALLDTQITSPLNGQSLVFNGSKWVNTTAFAGDYNALQNLPNLNLYHRYNTFTADANTIAEHTSNFTYAVNAPYVGSIQHFGANGYGLQLNSSYSSGGVNIAFRTRNGDAGAWNGWGRFWTNFDFVPDTEPTNNTVVQRNSGGYVKATYLYMNAPVVDATPMTDIVTTQNDGYLRRNGVNSVRSWLGLGSAAYTNDASYNLQFVTNRGNTTSNGMSIAFDGIGHDPYGIMSVTRGTGGNYSYYGMTRSGQIGWGIGIDLSNRIAFGTSANGSNNYTFAAIQHTFDSGGNAVHSGNINAGSLTINGSSSFGGNATINNGAALSLGNDGNTGYYFSVINQRGDTLHKYLLRNSDNVALGWKENWYDGTKYHSWTTDTLGFVANSKLTTVSSGDGSVTYQGSLEVRGTNAGITFHYPGNYATSLWMSAGGELNFNGSGIYSSGHLNTNGYINAGSNITAGNDVVSPNAYHSNIMSAGRVIAGYDSGVAGSVNASNWFRSSGDNGWFNSSYGGGIYMQDSTWVRVYNGKGFLVQNEINGTRIVTNDGFKSTTFKGLAGDYDQNGTSDKIIWTIGDGWNTIGTHYGLGYSFNNSLFSSQHQIVGRSNGNTTFTLSLTTGGAMFTGAVYANSALVIPVGITSPVNGSIWIA